LGIEPAGKFLDNKFEPGGSSGMSLEGDGHELKVTLKVEFGVFSHFWYEFGRVCHELHETSHHKLKTYLEGANFNHQVRK
jgi:hypothetical protein